MKILNLYAGIGGNRKLWGDEHEITAVEYRQDIADVYKYYFPNDTVIIADAHQYLLDHYKEYEFIWTSSPCPSHSRANFWASKTAENRKAYYPEMGLYQEIIFLKNWFSGLWVAENVEPYYIPLYEPDKILSRHCFWANFQILDFKAINEEIFKGTKDAWINSLGFNLSNFKLDSRKDQIYRNCVHPETGLHILDCAMNIIRSKILPRHNYFN